MSHPVYRVRSVEIVAPFTLQLQFDDGAERRIDFRPILTGDLFGPLRDVGLFDQVHLDPEIHTLVWPNGADFDPATLHDWPSHEAALHGPELDAAPAMTLGAVAAAVHLAE